MDTAISHLMRVIWLGLYRCYQQRCSPLTLFQNSRRKSSEKWLGKVYIGNSWNKFSRKPRMILSATAVANEFLKHGKESVQPLTPMHIQKLVYFAYGWHLALSDEPLIREHIEAWEYGPVIATLYHEFKRYGSGTITGFAKEPNWEKIEFTFYVPWIDQAHCSEEQRTFAKSLIAKVWQAYGSFTALQLSRMTHEPGTPWSQARAQDKRTIPDDLIREYFTELARKNEPDAQ